MTEVSNRKEIATLEWKRATSIAWPTIAIISSFQAVLAENPVRIWQIIFVMGLFLCEISSIALDKINGFNYSKTPTIVFLLLSPLILGSKPQESWMSIGLVTFAAVIYFSTIGNIYIAITVIVLITLYQTFLVKLNLASITDNADIAFLNSYFSIVWTVGMGVASYYIRRQYLGVANSLQDIVNKEIDDSISKFESIRSINEEDSRNLRLHGTVLNTLIYIRNMVTHRLNTSVENEALVQEIRELAGSPSKEYSKDFRQKLEELISIRTRNRVKISITTTVRDLKSRFFEETTLEILRELILNCEKHTSATSASLIISQKLGKTLDITFIDNSLMNLNKKERAIALKGAHESINLNRLISASQAKLRVSMMNRNRYRKIQITLPVMDLELESRSALARSRNAGLNDFSLNYVRASTLVTILSIFGYLIVGLNRITLVLTILMLISLVVFLQYKKRSFFLLAMSVSSLLILPSLVSNSLTCTQLGIVPWLFNHILTVGFLVAIQVKNRFIKWIPIIIFTFECVYLPNQFPNECKNILLGSLPGIPLIIVLSLALLSIRKREIILDEIESLKIDELLIKKNEVDLYRESAYSLLLEDCLAFASSLEENRSVDPQVFTLQIQKIQSFLICSENFDSYLIRRVYDLFRTRQEQGVLGRLTLLGTNFSNEVSIDAADALVNRLTSHLSGQSANLTIVKNDSIELHFDGVDIDGFPDSLEGFPVFVKN